MATVWYMHQPYPLVAEEEEDFEEEFEEEDFEEEEFEEEEEEEF
jgi:hypothetical protein